VIFGSETGNAEGFASTVASKKGTKSVEADKFDFSSLKSGDTLLVVTSSWGAGEPPTNAQKALAKLQAGVSLSGVNFAVFGIGSTGFPDFCHAAIDFDAVLEKNGASRLAPVVTSDEGNYDKDLAQWLVTI
ncbi:MAG: flavodoxin domain-containing protein, partial [Brevinema sp.]